MFSGKAHNDLNDLYFTFCRIRTDFYPVIDQGVFFSKPEAEKPAFIRNLHFEVFTKMINNDYLFAQHDARELMFEWTQQMVPFFNGFFNSQFNPNTWGSMPPNNQDSTYAGYFEIFLGIHGHMHNLLQDAGYIL